MKPNNINQQQTMAGTPPVSDVPSQLPMAGSTLVVRPFDAARHEPAGKPEPPINVRSVLNALRRRWFVGILLGAGLGTGTAYVVWETIPAPYTAFTQIRVRTVVPTVPLRSTNPETEFETFKQTQMQLVRERDVLETALRKDGISALPFLRESGEDGVELLQKKLEVKSNSIEFFRISLSGDRPEDLKKIVLAVTEAYDKVVLSADRTAIEERRKRYEKIRDIEESRLRGLRDGLQLLIKDPSKEKGFVERQRRILDERANLRQQIGDIEIRMINLNIIRDLQQEASGKAAKKKEPVPAAVLDAALAEDPEFRKAKSKVEDLEKRLKRQEDTLTPNHPEIVKTKAELAAAKKELDAMRKKKEPEVRKLLEEQLRLSIQPKGKPRDYEIEKKVLEKQKDFLTIELEKRKVEQRAAGLNDVAIQRQTEEIEVQRKYTQALNDEIKRMQAQIDLGKAEPRVIVPSRAEVSSRPNTRKKYMGTALAGFGMFGFVLGGILMLDIRLQRISSLQQVVGKIGLPVVGAIPAMPRLATSKQGGDWSSKARYWHSVLTESVDSARTVLLREAEQNGIQVLMIASAMGGEGKTTVSCHLATSLARAGRNVLLVDGDMRRPMVHGTFDLEITPGLADLLTGDAEIAEALHESGIPGLTILPAGRISQKALQSLAQDRPGQLLAELRARFEFILFDSAPVLPVTDSLMVAQLTDGVLMSIRRDVSRASKVLAACERLHKLGVPMVGAIAVGLDDESYGYSYSYRYGYDPYQSTPRN